MRWIDVATAGKCRNISLENPNIVILGDNKAKIRWKPCYEIKNVEKNEMIFIMFRNFYYFDIMKLSKTKLKNVNIERPSH